MVDHVRRTREPGLPPLRRAAPRGARRWYAWAAAVLVALGSGLLVAAPARAADVPSSFRLSGSGYGHGVGMPQYGAYELSRRGATGRAILERYYTGASVGYDTTPLGIWVQVYGPDPSGTSSTAGDRGRTTSVTVRGGEWRLLKSGAGTVAKSAQDTTLTITTTTSGAVRVTVDGTAYQGDLFRIQWSGTRFWRATGNPSIATVKGAHGEYRHGQLTVTARSGIPNITNDLRINTEYLYGLAEMPSSWALGGGAAALAAQATVARSYAALKSTVRSGCRCHVVDDVRDQNFTGWKKENEGTGGRYGALWKAAVDATTRSLTEGRMLTYGGRPVEAHYFSSSGGRTAHSEEVWSSRIPYERSVADPYSKVAPGNSYASWTRTITQEQARLLFDLPNVASIKVTSRWTSGQARTITATNLRGTTRTVSGSADAVRAKVGARTTAGSLPAAWITGITAVP